MNKFSVLILTILFTVAGCGGGGGGGESSSTTPTKYLQDGIYLNDTDLVVMLVDTEQADGALLVGDYVDNSVYFNDTHTVVNTNTLKTTGLTYVSNTNYAYDSNVEITTTFTEQGANLSAVVDNQNLSYSFDKTSPSEELSSFVGTHTNPDDGSVWTINNDGTFTVNGVCIITGTLSRVKDYFMASNVNAANCSDAAMNASDYEARLLTVNQNGTTYVLSAMANGSNILWGSVPIAP
ncbi:hypothetical protein [Vibrio crassostreae]|uniref:hypothetical protein n=1 Tax=Vibrio crassostreae TaxID=246167 RepID=UPI00104F243B|nr:hypothetical protein [Vibrio crassostreae]TCT60157.1 hypothetical protein EDB31_15425 [Vibrio crassostreae]